MSNELTVPSKKNALEVYQKPNGLDPFLKQIREEIDSFVPDVSTKKGRDAIASIAYKVAKSKTALDDVGKELVAELKELPKKIDAERKRVRETLDAWRDEVRRPLTEWEQAEDDRIANHKNAIAFILQSSVVEDVNSETIKSKIADIEAIEIGKHFEEFELEAMHAKEHSLEKLQKLLFQTERHEQEQEELARLRAESAVREQKEREERIAREAEERAKLAAEEAAKKEREASERRELELKLQIERAEKEKLQAIESEKKRVADEAAKIEAERIKREKDTAHRSAINRESMQCFVDGGFTEDQAKLAVSLIAKKLIKNVTINY
jgi:septal ring factor EnvC (AmiA/AmiB activator)